MAILNDLPNELIHMIISKLSYRYRARVACASKKFQRLADSEDSYRAQYIRDFGHPPQEFICKPQWKQVMWFHTSAGPESEPPKHWKQRIQGQGHEYVGQESSWKRAYIRRHNSEFPQEPYSSLPAVPYTKKHREIVCEYRLMACVEPEMMLEYLSRLRRQSLLCRSLVLYHAIRHGVRPRLDAELAFRGWVLSRCSLELVSTEQEGSVTSRCYRCSSLRYDVYFRNQKRQYRLQEAEIGARSSMPQVPVHFGTKLYVKNLPK